MNIIKEKFLLWRKKILILSQNLKKKMWQQVLTAISRNAVGRRSGILTNLIWLDVAVIGGSIYPILSSSDFFVRISFCCHSFKTEVSHLQQYSSAKFSNLTRKKRLCLRITLKLIYVLRKSVIKKTVTV